MSETKLPPIQVVCADGQTLATDAQDSYEITCRGADTTAQPNSGLLSCTDCPVCHGKSLSRHIHT